MTIEGGGEKAEGGQKAAVEKEMERVR